MINGTSEIVRFLLHEFNTKLKRFSLARFDQVFICSSNKNAQLGLMAFRSFALQRSSH